jgi:hypothetical protein
MKNIMVAIMMGLLPAAGLYAGDSSKIHWVSPNENAAWSACESAVDPGSNYCSLYTANKTAMAGDTVYLKGGT